MSLAIAKPIELSDVQIAYLAEAIPLYQQLVSGQLGAFGGYSLSLAVYDDGPALDLTVKDVSPLAFEAVCALARLYLTPKAWEVGGITFDLAGRTDRFEILLGGRSIGSVAIDPKEAP